MIPSREAYETELVGLNDIVTLDNIPTTNNLVVQVVENGEASLFVMYQKAEGVLDALSNSRDTVTVTQQESFNSQSWSLAELKAGESFKYSNWGGYGEDKTLVIKVCSSSVQNNLDTSSVIIYMEGVTSASCQPIVTDPPTDPPTVTPPNDTGGCEDSPLQFLVGGKRRRCGWAQWSPQRRCKKWGVPSMCPETCGKVCPMCSDGRKKFLLENGALKSCWWVRNKNTSKRCQRLGVAETCRKTCGQCS